MFSRHTIGFCTATGHMNGPRRCKMILLFDVIVTNDKMFGQMILIVFIVRRTAAAAAAPTDRRRPRHAIITHNRIRWP